MGDPRTLGHVRLNGMIQAVDAHACGEPGRVIVGGVLDVPGRTMLDKMRHLQTHADGLRKLMLREPPASWTGSAPQRGPGPSTAHPAGPAPAPAWPWST